MERVHTKDLKTKYAPTAMVNWQEAGRTWPRPRPHVAHLLRGLVWDQHYRHSHPQCEGGMPGSFELRTDMAPDRLQAVEDWLRAEGFAFRFQQRRWRTWTRPDRPGEGLRPDGIEEDEKPNEYPSGASINVSMWDMIEKNFPEPGSERRLQGSSSSASPGKEKRSAGDRKRDRKWREYQESLAAEAAQGARGGTPAPSPQRANGGHHLGHATLGDFIQVAKQTQAKPRPLLLRKSGPSSNVESAHRGRMPADQASSSSSVAADRDVARACERACGVPCNRRVARQRARQHSAAVEGAVGIAQEEAAEWVHGMAIHPQTVAAIAAELTAVAAHGAATARVNVEFAAADEEARLTQEAIACKEAEVRALEEALAQERAKKEAEERVHAEATAKVQADAAKKDAIEAARRKVAEERAKTEAELAALEADKARLQQARKAEAARAREEAEARAAAATAAAMEEAEAKLRRETPAGGSRVETLRKLFEGDASSRMKLDEWRDFRGHYNLFRRNVEDWNEGDEQARLLSMLPEAWIKRVTKEESKRAKSNHTVKMMLPKEYHTNVVAWTRKNVARDVKRHSLRNALLITVSGDREKTAMWCLDECELSGQTIRLQAIPARMSCDEILDRVGEEVLKEYRSLHHTRGLRPGDRDVNNVGEGPGGEAAMDPAGAGGDETLVDDDDDDEPAEVAVCAFVASNLSAGNKPGNWKPLQQGWRKKEKRDPRRIGDPPLSFGEFIRAHPQGCFVCYGRKKGFNHDHRTCPIHQADTEAYKKAHGSKRRAPAGIREAKVEVDKDELSKLVSQGTELAKEIQEIKRNWVPRSDNKNKENNQNDQNKDKDKKPTRRERKKGVNEVDAKENTPTSTTDAP